MAYLLLIILLFELDVEIIESDAWDPRCTHIIIEKPSKTEKFLAAVAAGIWYIILT